MGETILFLKEFPLSERSLKSSREGAKYFEEELLDRIDRSLNENVVLACLVCVTGN